MRRLETIDADIRRLEAKIASLQGELDAALEEREIVRAFEDDKWALDLRMAVGRAKGATWREIGDTHGVTPERVRQRVSKGLRKARFAVERGRPAPNGVSFAELAELGLIEDRPG